MPIFRVKSVKIYTGQKNLHWYIRGIRDKYQVWVVKALSVEIWLTRFQCKKRVLWRVYKLTLQISSWSVLMQNRLLSKKRLLMQNSGWWIVCLQSRGGFCQPSPTVCYHRSSSTFQTRQAWLSSPTKYHSNCNPCHFYFKPHCYLGASI